MACLTTLKGISADCTANLAGLRKLLIAPYDESIITKTDGSKVTLGTGGKWKQYEFAKTTASITSTLTIAQDTGVLYYTSELVANFNKMTAEQLDEFDNLVKGEVMIVAEDRNGLIHVLGVEEGVRVSAGTAQTGAARDDANSISITFQDFTSVPAYTADALPSVTPGE